MDANDPTYLIHKYFVQILDKSKRGKVQEVEPRLFFWLKALPQMDPVANEPNFVTLERYPEEGVLLVTEDVVSYYAGVAKITGSETLLPNFHYFLSVEKTKLKAYKKKPVLIRDHAIVLQERKHAST
jgi:hypothetical protein